MSSLPDQFECHWQPSRGMLVVYLVAQVLALTALYKLEIALWACAVGVLLCLAHAVWVLPDSILLSRPGAFTALRRTTQGWQLWSEQGGWQAVQLCRDSMALPWLVMLRFRLPGKSGMGWRRYGLCIPRDAMAPDVHRRLRLRLKFSRRRWAAPE